VLNHAPDEVDALFSARWQMLWSPLPALHFATFVGYWFVIARWRLSLAYHFYRLTKRNKTGNNSRLLFGRIRWDLVKVISSPVLIPYAIPPITIILVKLIWQEDQLIKFVDPLRETVSFGNSEAQVCESAQMNFTAHDG
jgi:hypothetical protein